MTVGNKGRVVLPAEVRARHNWTEGTTLIAIETAGGVTLVERSEALQAIRAQLSGSDILGDLFSERRAAADNEDAGHP